MNSSALIPFRLPRGYIDHGGAVHRDGLLRPATALDEIRALGDFRAHLWPEAFPGVLFARVIVKLGSLEAIDAGLVQSLSQEDRAHLERLYREANGYAAD